MENSPYTGKREALLQCDSDSDSVEANGTASEGRHVFNLYVTTGNRSLDAVRVEIVKTAYNLLAERIE